MMGGDVLRLMDHLQIDKADLLGYSMGGYISAWLLAHHSNRFHTVTMGGVGSPFVTIPPQFGQAIANALLSPDDASVDGTLAKTFRLVAKADPRNDMKALAACITRVRETMSPSDFANVEIPAMVVAGDKDTLSANPQILVDAIPGAKLVLLPGDDHLTAVIDQRFKDAVTAFVEGSTG
jgi:pimeloyl-ACP methyl ester carboxylesterase